MMEIITNKLRYPFIQCQILNLYKNFNITKFPIDVLKILKSMPNCVVMSYNEIAFKRNISVNEVAMICDSLSGCTHYDRNTNKYLVFYNDCHDNNNVSGRILWTLTHELGHIILGHLPTIAQNMASENGISNSINEFFETEAELFAANFLSPFSLFDLFNIKSPLDIKYTFGLSNLAANNRMNTYIKLKDNYHKTPYDNDIIRIFKTK